MTKKHPAVIAILPIAVLLLVEIVLFLTNYKQGTFLVGWDNLIPEFNFAQDFTRNLFAVWQEYRGLGLLDGMSHAANLVHDVWRLVLSMFLPASLIRWAYILIMHLVGGAGMYVLLQRVLAKVPEKRWATYLVSLIGALFYQYNLGTIQQFFLPFEVFVVHFAALPWLLYSAYAFIESGAKRDFLLVSSVFLLSAPQAHVPTLFIVSIVALGILLTVTILLSAERTTALKRATLILFSAFTINAYWGLPFAYATFANSQTITNSKNFEMATNDIFYRNHKYGNLTSVALLKGFSLDFQHYDFKTGSQHLMMQPWREHLYTPYFLVPAWIFFAIAIIGALVALGRLKKHGHPGAIPFVMLFFIGFSLLGSDIPLLRDMNTLMRNHIPLFHTVFRFTFTKFSLLYALGYSVALAYGLLCIVTVLKTSGQNTALTITIAFLISYSFPSFRGHFFYENLAVRIPKEYFDAFSFFRQQRKGARIAILPIPWYWAWLQPTWGTIGSGFTWYGIPQPTTDLAFTPWSDKNENFYWELEHALYSENTPLLARVFRKYDITWIYLDKNIQHAEARRMTYERYEEILNAIPVLQRVQTFGNIAIYRVKTEGNPESFVTVEEGLPTILPTYQYDNDDTAFEEYGDYINPQRTVSDIYYPYRSLFSNKDVSKREYLIEEDDRSLVFKAIVLGDPDKRWLSIPKNTGEFTVDQFGDPNGRNTYTPSLFIDGNSITVALPKRQTRVYRSNDDEKFFRQANDACEKNPLGQAEIETRSQAREEYTSLKLVSRGSKNCIKAGLPYLPHQYAYLIKVVASSSPIRGLLMNIYNETMKKTDLEVYLPHDNKRSAHYFIVPPRQTDGLGYTIYFNNFSEGSELVENTLYSVEAYQIPYRFMKQLKFQKFPLNAYQPSRSAISKREVKVNHPNPAYYKINIKQNESRAKQATQEETFFTLILSQSFDPGWTAWVVNVKCQMTNDKCSWTEKFMENIQRLFPFIFGRQLKDHVLVNNWANGWILPGNQATNNELTIVLFFTPQLLQWLGFVLLPLPFLFLKRFKT